MWIIIVNSCPRSHQNLYYFAYYSTKSISILQNTIKLFDQKSIRTMVLKYCIAAIPMSRNTFGKNYPYFLILNQP